MQRYSLNSVREGKNISEIPSKHAYTYSQYNGQSQSVSIQGKSPKIISFVGKITSNVDQVLSTIKCCQRCQCQFREVLQIFAQKMERLRADRDKIRDKYIDDIYELQDRIKYLENENKNLLYNTQKPPHNINFNSDTQSIKFDFAEQYQQQQSEQLIIDHKSKQYFSQNSSILLPPQQKKQKQQKQQKQQSKYDNILKMAIKYNLTNDQLENLIVQYLNAEGQLIANDDQIKKLKKLQQQLQKKRIKKQIRSQLQNFLKPSSHKKIHKQTWEQSTWM